MLLDGFTQHRIRELCAALEMQGEQRALVEQRTIEGVKAEICDMTLDRQRTLTPKLEHRLLSFIADNYNDAKRFNDCDRRHIKDVLGAAWVAENCRPAP